MAAIAMPILLKIVFESLGNVAPTSGHDCKEVHMQTEQMALLQCISSNDYSHTNNKTIRQHSEKRGISAMIEACREYMHLGGQLPHSKLDRIQAPTAALLVGAEVSTIAHL